MRCGHVDPSWSGAGGTGRHAEYPHEREATRIVAGCAESPFACWRRAAPALLHRVLRIVGDYCATTGQHSLLKPRNTHLSVQRLFSKRHVAADHKNSQYAGRALSAVDGDPQPSAYN